jgi:hypothetical protein
VGDVEALPEVVRAREARRRAMAEARRPFDLCRGPLLRALLLRLGEAEWVLGVVMHHMASDGWSLDVLVRETAALYAAFREGGAAPPGPLPPLPVQYLDYAVWQRGWLRGEVLEEQLAWWRRELADAPALLDLAADRPRPPVPSHRGAGVPVSLPAGLNRAVGACSRRVGATPFMVLLAAFQALLYRRGGQDDVLVGTPVANRTRVELEGLIGPFINALVLRGRFGPSARRRERGQEPPLTFRALLARTRETALGAFAHQDLPFERLVEDLGVERSLAHHPLHQVALQLHNQAVAPLRLPGLTLELLPADTGTSKLDLLLSLSESGEGLAGWWEYATDLFDRATIARLSGHLETLLTAAVADPERQVAELPLLSAADRAQLQR